MHLKISFEKGDHLVSAALFELYVSIGSASGLAQNRRHAIARPNYGLVFRRDYPSLGLGEAKFVQSPGEQLKQSIAKPAQFLSLANTTIDITSYGCICYGLCPVAKIPLNQQIETGTVMLQTKCLKDIQLRYNDWVSDQTSMEYVSQGRN